MRAFPASRQSWSGLSAFARLWTSAAAELAEAQKALRCCHRRLGIGVGIVKQRSRRQPIPERPQISAHLGGIEFWELCRLLLEVLPEAGIAAEQAPDFRVVAEVRRLLGSDPSFRQYFE